MFLEFASKLVRVICEGACGGAVASALSKHPDYQEDIIKEVGKGLAMAVVIEPVIGLLVGFAARQGFAYFRGLGANEQRIALDEVAKMRPEDALEASREVLREAKLSPEAKQAIEGYVLSIPHAVRRGTTRFDDGGVTATLATQVPRSLAEFARLLPARPPLFRRGTPLPGHDYVLDQLLGQGGYGEVWKAVPTEFTEMPPRAVKFFFGDLSRTALTRETKLVAGMQAKSSHENIVQLHNTNMKNDPPFVVFEYVPGGDLGGWLAAYDDRAPTPKEVHAILLQVANGLKFAHANNIVHRDIKPGNVLIGADWRVKIADFGIGALAVSPRPPDGPPAPAAPAAAAPAAGGDAFASAGTPVYIDPDREIEKPAPAEDVYALGVLGLQLLLGDLNRSPRLAYRNALTAKGVSPSFLEVLETCIDGRPRRYKNGAEVTDALLQLDFRTKKSAKAEAGREQESTPAAKKKWWLSRSRIKRDLNALFGDKSKAQQKTGADPDARPASEEEQTPPVILDHFDAPTLAVLSPGRFLMGAPPDEPLRSAAEGPVHEVVIDYALAVAITPVTFEQWDAAAEALGYRPSDAGWGRGDRPVVNVSWVDAQRYLEWLNQLTGKQYRLLSEAEWEYACRAGTRTPFSTGETITWERANFDDTRPWNLRAGALEAVSVQLARTIAGKNLNRERTTPVGSFASNPFWLADMHGNVWEWVQDGWHADYTGAPADGRAWEGGEPGMRALRGGSFRTGAASLRSAHRFRRQQHHRSDQVGFRVARLLDPSETLP